MSSNTIPATPRRIRGNSSRSPAYSTGPATLMVLDDDPLIRRSVRRILEHSGYRIVEAASVEEARQLFKSDQIDLVLLDVGLPDGSGLNLLDDLSREPASPTVVVVSASSARDDVKRSLKCGAFAYLHKPLDAVTLEGQVEAALIRRQSDREAREDRHALSAGLGAAQALLEEMPSKLGEALSSAWDLRHVETGAHVRRIGAYTEAVARTLGMGGARAETLGRVAVLHDIGKIAIPDAILTKPAKLTPEEFAVMKLHPTIGAKLLGGIRHPFIELAATVALRHHERWDGSGYPDGLHGEECPFEARIVAVVDVYDALGQPRCYKPGWSEEQVLTYFKAQSGKLFEPLIVDALLSSLPALRDIARKFPESQPAGDGFRAPDAFDGKLLRLGVG